MSSGPDTGRKMERQVNKQIKGANRTSSPRIVELLKQTPLDRKSDEPLYRQVGKRIIALIRKGELRPGDMLPSIWEMDYIIYPGIGRVTIVNAIAALVRDGHLLAKHGKGYFVNKPYEEKTRVGLVLPLFSVYLQIYAKFAARLQIGTEEMGHRLWVMNSNENSRDFIEACEELVYKWGAKAIVAVPPYDREKRHKVDRHCLSYLKKLNASGLVDHVIVFDRKVEDGFVSIYQDRQAGRKLLLEAAAAKKVRKTVFLMDSGYSAQERKELVAFGRNLGIELSFEKKLLCKDMSGIEGMAMSGVEAVFTDGDIFATRIMGMAGGKPPFRVTGYDATNYAALHKPPITSVDPGLCDGADFILKYMRGEVPATTRTYVMKPKLVEGETF